MIKKIVLIAGLLVVGSYAYDANSYKSGFESGLNALRFQIQNDGVSPSKIALTKQYLLILPIDKISMGDVLYMQYTASRNDFKTNLTKDEIIFGNYERIVDAQFAQQKIKELFNYDAKIVENIKDYYTYPILAEPVFEAVYEAFKKDGVIKETKIIYVNKNLKNTTIKEENIIENSNTVIEPISSKVPLAKPTVVKNAELKYNKVQAYKLNGDSKFSKNFAESFIVEKQSFKTANTIRTNEGESFVKVLNQNLYFIESDVEIK